MKAAALISLSLLFACSSDSKDSDSSTDTGETGVEDTGPQAPPITMKAFFEDGMTGVALKKADICVE